MSKSTRPSLHNWNLEHLDIGYSIFADIQFADAYTITYYYLMSKCYNVNMYAFTGQHKKTTLSMVCIVQA